MNQDINRSEYRRKATSQQALRSSARARRNNKGPMRLILFGLFLVFLIGGIYFTYQLYTVVSAVFVHPVAFDPGQTSPGTPPASSSPNNQGGVPGQPNNQSPQPNGQPAPSGTTTALPQINFDPNAQWAGKDRLNFLLLGIDQRAGDDPNKTRSDTMIIVSIDPAKKTVAMLSIPRDLWVNVSGYQPNKINTFHFLGGPELAKRAVQENFGIKINYWIRVNFRGFEQVVNAMGGLVLDVERPIHDDEYPLNDKDDNIRRLYIPSGLQQMDGELALEYARSRHGDSDFGRMRRQQQILYAMRDQGLKQGLDLARLGTIRDILNTGFVQTDFPINNLPALYNLAKQIDTGAIASKTIDPNMVTDQSGDLIPDWSAIRPMVKDLFSSDPHVAKENAKILVRNGTPTGGLAIQLTDTLNKLGYSTIEPDKAENTNYPDTVIITYSNKPYTAEALANLLDVPVSSIRTQSVKNPPADIIIIVGKNTRLPTSP